MSNKATLPQEAKRFLFTGFLVVFIICGGRGYSASRGSGYILDAPFTWSGDLLLSLLNRIAKKTRSFYFIRVEIILRIKQEYPFS